MLVFHGGYNISIVRHAILEITCTQAQSQKLLITYSNNNNNNLEAQVSCSSADT